MPTTPSLSSLFANQWRCSQCGTLLGGRHADHVEVRYKKAAYAVRVLQGVAELEATCRRCGTPAVLVCEPQPQPSRTRTSR